VERVSRERVASVSTTRRSWYRRHRDKRANDDTDDENELPRSLAPRPLVPSLLAVSKQVYQEGCDILYGNKMVFADLPALSLFLFNIGSAGASHLKKLYLKGWGSHDHTRSYNIACFAALERATNLEKFWVDASATWRCQPKECARSFYKDAFPWLEAIGTAKGRFDAALDILVMAGLSSERGFQQASTRQPSDDETRKSFNAELIKHLQAQRQRVMDRPRRR
jgi:hypothetical protein